MICLNYANANKHSDHKIGAEDCERHGMKVMRRKMKRKDRKSQHKRKSKTPNVAKPTINQELNLLKPMSPMESFYQSSDTSDIIEIKFIDNDMTELEVQNEPSNSNSLETPEDSDGDSEDRFFALMALEARGIPKHKRLKLHTDIVKLVYKARYEND
uniref:BESS domain-containing protein n=1 Tax=Ciona savignyi TaxID=51511 RepID=H2YHI3_CIOSA